MPRHVVIFLVRCSTSGRLEASHSVFPTRRQWLKDQGESQAVLYVDEDPSIFSHIIKYLTNCGQPGAVQLLPKDHQEREELRWGPQGRVLLTETGDFIILALLHPQHPISTSCRQADGWPP